VRQFSPLPRRAHERLAALEAAAQVSEGNAERTFSRSAIADPGAARRALEEHLAAVAMAAAVGMAAETQGESGDSPEEALARAELLHIVRGALAELDDPDEALIVRRYCIDGEPLEDIARDLDISKSWASRLHTRAIGRLAKRLRGFAG
jgi:RNA polymerase sigma factor for flagellar operon FliA